MAWTADAAAVLLWSGAAGAWLFIVVFLIDGWTRPGYHPMRDPVSALALGPRGWLQTTNFVVCGAAIGVGAIGVFAALHSIPLAVTIGVFGLALVASGIFPMDAMRGYPPGTPDETPAETSLRHRLHDHAGVIVFGAIPVCAAIAAFTLPDPLWGWSSGAIAIVSTLGFLWFGAAWEADAPRSGLIQRVTIITGWGWLGALFVATAAGV